MLGLRKLLFRFYWAVEKLIVPNLQHSQYIFSNILKSYVNNESRWLDLGCGHQIIPDWMPQSQDEQASLVNETQMIVGIDYDILSLKNHKYIKNRIVGDIDNLPFKENSFNLITANMVIEHIKYPPKAINKIHHVLDSSGLFIFHTPNLLNYKVRIASFLSDGLKAKIVKFLEDREEKDIFPTYYRMNKPGLLKKLSLENGFKPIELKLINTSASGMLGPLVIIELIIIRILQHERFAKYRSNIICVLQKIRT